MLIIVVECCWYRWYRYSISLYDVETTPCNACHSGLMIICRCKHEPTGIAWHSSFFSICFPSRLVYIVHPGRLTEGSPTNHPWKEGTWSEPNLHDSVGCWSSRGVTCCRVARIKQFGGKVNIGCPDGKANGFRAPGKGLLAKWTKRCTIHVWYSYIYLHLVDFYGKCR